MNSACAMSKGSNGEIKGRNRGDKEIAVQFEHGLRVCRQAYKKQMSKFD